MASSGAQLRLNGYTYLRKNKYNGKVYWRCVLFRSQHCRATAITREGRDGRNVLKEGVHEHPPEDSESDSDVVSHDSESSHREDDDSDDPTEASGSDDNERSTTESDDEGVEWEVWDELSDEEESEKGSENEEDEKDMESDEDDSHDSGYKLCTKAIKQQKDAFRNLSGGSIAIREVTLKEADKYLICILCELCWNLQRGYFSYVNRYEMNLLCLIEEDVFQLASKDISWETKKKDLFERATDRFIPILLNVILPHMT